jgi:hypothetical protein
MKRHKVKFVKKLFGENDVEAVLQRLDRLTQDEARATAAQTLVVVYGLVQNMRTVMDGEQPPPGLFLVQCWTSFQMASYLRTVSGMLCVSIPDEDKLLLLLTWH